MPEQRAFPALKYSGITIPIKSDSYHVINALKQFPTTADSTPKPAPHASCIPWTTIPHLTHIDSFNTNGPDLSRANSNTEVSLPIHRGNINQDIPLKSITTISLLVGLFGHTGDNTTVIVIRPQAIDFVTQVISDEAIYTLLGAITTFLGPLIAVVTVYSWLFGVGKLRPWGGVHDLSIEKSMSIKPCSVTRQQTRAQRLFQGTPYVTIAQVPQIAVVVGEVDWSRDKSGRIAGDGEKLRATDSGQREWMETENRWVMSCFCEAIDTERGPQPRWEKAMWHHWPTPVGASLPVSISDQLFSHINPLTVTIFPVVPALTVCTPLRTFWTVGFSLISLHFAINVVQQYIC
ncbi:hypothetical protein BDK51DRAFT_41095 [Blyttiomyces helicus]|uniref:Uncharacterized protein n=1 Tax=Blyttiomyces helicus TaxID=388810 RepID=A0A4V1IS67_9FUNG|nr:hypothetical protein BDK51DRAFT_41095 [Blyttiomyces helicus]|eukprot:RKO92497.1 hypothetical protein BDK51DRAFT_41095 [Blyttiomyces helicus]